MSAVAAIVGVTGAAFTVFACVRLLAALRRRAQNELVIGWFALMIAGAVATFMLLRIT